MSSSTRNTVREFVRTACVYFTVLTLLFNALIFLSDSGESNYFSPKGIGCCLLFAVLLTLCQRLLFLSSLPVAARVLFHYMGCALSFLVCFFLLGQTKSWVFFLALTVLYLLAAVPCLIVYGAKRRKANEKEEYHSIYSARH